MAKKQSRNERLTEAFLRSKLTALKYFENSAITVEEQKSDNTTIARLLKSASKSGDGLGKPEFIIQTSNDPEFVIVVECKADPKKHATSDFSNPRDYALDGVLHYAKHLCRSFNVLAIAVSGQTEDEILVSAYVVRKGAFDSIAPLKDKYGKPVAAILPFADFFELYVYDPLVHAQKERSVLDFSRDLHNFIRDYAHLSDAEKPLIVSGILLALKDEVYYRTYSTYPDSRLPQYTLDTIKAVVDGQDIPHSKKLGVKQQYGFIQTHTKLIDREKSIGMSPLRKIVDDLKEHVFPFVSIYQDYDIVGRFYNEFLRYSGGDGKLGIILTPKHVTELFSELTQVGRNDTILDPCCGTAGFLISAMNRMIRDCDGDGNKIKRVKRYGLIGIESQPKMFALAASNMILRGDGSCQLFEGSCFNESIERDIKALKETIRKGVDKANRPNIGFINPPYSLKGEGLSELQFVKTMLDYLDRGGTGVAIVPIGCVIENSDLKRQLLQKHTLEAVISMPDDLFGKSATVVSCILIFTAHKKHSENKSSWFSRLKDDGFVTLKHIGRVDHYSRWDKIREKLVRDYQDRREEPGLSILKSVRWNDEWCAEAYIETDYERLSDQDYEHTVRDYLKFIHPEIVPEAERVNSKKWSTYCYSDLFDITRGRRVIDRNMEPGQTPLIRCIKDNNGVTDYVNLPPMFQGNAISVNYNGSVGEAFYQPKPFFATDDILVLRPKPTMFPKFNKHIALFCCTVIKLERFRFHYSRKWNIERMTKSKIRLPKKDKQIDCNYIEGFMKKIRFTDQL